MILALTIPAVFSTVFCFNVQPEVGSDVISCVAVHVDYVSMDVHVKLGDSSPYGSAHTGIYLTPKLPRHIAPYTTIEHG